MTIHAPARVHAGTPTGGQFATTTRTEPDLVLAATFDGDPELTGHALLTAAMAAARRKAYQQGLPTSAVEDIAQSAIATALQTKRNTPSTVLTARYLERVTHNHASLTARGAMTPQNHKARGLLYAQVNETEQRLGRHLTTLERQGLAEEIWQGWHDPRHRPSRDFDQQVRANEVDIDTLSLAQEPEAPGMEFFDEEASAAAEQLAEIPDGLLAARRQVWDVLATLSDAPAVVAGAIQEERATAHRRALSDRGGVLAALDGWQRGEADASTDALFAPFGDLDSSEKDQVCSLLRRHRHLADDLHAAALRAATRPRRAKG